TGGNQPSIQCQPPAGADPARSTTPFIKPVTTPFHLSSFFSSILSIQPGCSLADEPERNRVKSGIFAGMARDKTTPPSLQISLQVSHEMLRLIAEINEFKGRWEALQTLSPERLRA